MTQYTYEFGSIKTDGKASQNNLLGGKGANLAEMSRLGLPVPAGFTISTQCCNDFFDLDGTLPQSLDGEIDAAMANVETQMGMKFGDPENPLLVSCRSGARKSMPGMMETILNVGLCSTTIPGPDPKDRKRMVCIRCLPPVDHDVFRRGYGKGRTDRTRRRHGHPSQP